MFRFTIRDLLWLMVVAAALTMAWLNFVARGALEQENHLLRARNRQLQSRVEERQRIEAWISADPRTQSNQFSPDP